MTPDDKAAMIDRVLIRSDTRHGGRGQALPALEDEVLQSGIDASKAEIGRRAALLALDKKITPPLATLGEMCTGIWTGRNA